MTQHGARVAPIVRVAIKRVYEQPTSSDGMRVLVDRLWARGISKEAAALDAWMKDLGPSDALRTWFGHQSARWQEFVERYRHELVTPLRQLLLAELQGVAAGSPITLVYGARDTKENEAVVLRDYLLQQKARPPDGTWNAESTLLLTVAVVAAAHADAIAPDTTVTQLVAPILHPQERDRALAKLVTDGHLHRSTEGWQLTSRGRRQVEHLRGAD